MKFNLFKFILSFFDKAPQVVAVEAPKRKRIRKPRKKMTVGEYFQSLPPERQAKIARRVRELIEEERKSGRNGNCPSLEH